MEEEKKLSELDRMFKGFHAQFQLVEASFMSADGSHLKTEMHLILLQAWIAWMQLEVLRSFRDQLYDQLEDIKRRLETPLNGEF